MITTFGQTEIDDPDTLMRDNVEPILFFIRFHQITTYNIITLVNNILLTKVIIL